MNKINFVGFISVDHANPNGDPLAGNMPRIDDESIGEISQVCLRRKVRNRLMNAGYPIFVQSDDNRLDDYNSLSARLSGELDLSQYKTPRELAEAAGDKWLDVRAFGQVMAFKAKDGTSVSAHLRGPISISPAFSVDPVRVENVQITKSVNGSESDSKGADTMGMTYRVHYGLYRFFGAVDVELAEKNHLSEDDVNAVIEGIRTMFVGNGSTARTEGSILMEKLIVIKHNSKLGSMNVARINRLIEAKLKDGVEIPHGINDYTIDISGLDTVDGIEVTEVRD